jgi:hypothetical protein
VYDTALEYKKVDSEGIEIEANYLNNGAALGISLEPGVNARPADWGINATAIDTSAYFL